MLIAWAAGGKMMQRIQTNAPIYSLAYNSRRQQLMAGYNRCVRVFRLISAEDAQQHGGGSDVLERRSVPCAEHVDVVGCIVSAEGRFYSAG
ncbi:hypothetical protein BDK51DRAFT_43184 [Blyttiomyces helicus]|uniref:Uncharacterized protein n=1 Tax=Blyttiomyces helicus TaxID=388810 RepID=A0A4P9W0C7_9FUNG|nr:hypothetical protein BDK51DRAFT_43184 [Blyttiomyces helicus]|eukprot:RKO84000.1 hypothetical protein BDK51DRAFT_43184 [Blyttiomyces helicus]